MSPIATLNRVLSSMALPEGISWLEPGPLHHSPPNTELYAWLVKLPDPSVVGSVSISRRIVVSIAEAARERIPEVEERVRTAIGEFQQALRDGAALHIEDMEYLP